MLQTFFLSLSLFKFNQHKKISSYRVVCVIRFDESKFNKSSFPHFQSHTYVTHIWTWYPLPPAYNRFSVIWLCIFTHIMIVFIINFTHNSTNDSLSFNFTQVNCPHQWVGHKKLSVFPLWINFSKASRSVFFFGCDVIFFGGVKSKFYGFLGILITRQKVLIFPDFRNFTIKVLLLVVAKIITNIYIAKRLLMSLTTFTGKYSFKIFI